MSSGAMKQYLINYVLDYMPKATLRYMPAGTYRDFYLWAISEDNPQRQEFLECVSFFQVVEVLYRTIEGYVEQHHWETLAEYTGLITAYQVFEVVSDNIAIGLGIPPQLHDKTYSTRIQVLREFNTIMVDRLVGNITDTGQALSPMRPLINQISLLKQSMSEAKQNATMQLYLEHNPDVTAYQLEYSMWDVLVANIESSYDMMIALKDLAIYDLFKDGLIRRYHSVNRLLESIPSGLHDYVYTGSETILVTPSFGYMLGVVYEILTPMPAYNKLIQNGTIGEALYKAATLVRLQNDIGTNLLEMDATKRRNYLLSLADTYPECLGERNALRKILQQAGRNDILLVRLRKDLDMGEFNLALQQLDYTQPIEEGLNELAEILQILAEIYVGDYKELERLTDEITMQTGSSQISDLILRVVFFHERLYRNTYKSQQGDYAV